MLIMPFYVFMLGYISMESAEKIFSPGGKGIFILGDIVFHVCIKRGGWDIRGFCVFGLGSAPKWTLLQGGCFCVDYGTFFSVGVCTFMRR